MMLQALAIERAAATRTAERVLHDYYIAREIRSGQKSTPQSANDEPHAARILPAEDAESVMLNRVSSGVRPAVLLPVWASMAAQSRP